MSHVGGTEPAAAGRPSSGRDAREPATRRVARSSAPPPRSAESGPPDDPRPHTDPTPHGTDDLTGSDLIMRELGGRVINEIGET
jgi:hypothetical protein